MLYEIFGHFRVLAFTMLVFFFTACSSTWVVSRDLEGGVIGYRGFDDSEEALLEISKKISCPYGFYGVGDDGKSETYKYTSYETVSARGVRSHYGNRGYSTSHDLYQVSIPVERTGTHSWREYAYKCRKTPEGASHQQQHIQIIRPVAE